MKQKMNPTLIPVLSRCFLTALVAVIPAAFAAETSTPAFTEEPDKTMAAAHESFLKGQREKAAAEIHKAAAYVKRQSEEVGPDSRAAVKKSGETLDKLGDGVKNGTVKSADELKKAFAASDHTMASAWHKTAEATKKDGKDASQDLKKAGTSLDASAKWSGHELEAGAKESVNAVKKSGQAGAKEVDKWFKGIGDGIKNLAGKL